MIIAFEGIDGSGKSTISTRLMERLEDKGLRVRLLRSPYETSLGIGILNLVKKEYMCARAQACLHAAFHVDFIDHVNTIRNIVDVIILDRTPLSWMAYNYSKGCDVCEGLKKPIIDTLYSIGIDYMFWCDVGAMTAANRITKRKGRRRIHPWDIADKLKPVHDSYYELSREFNMVKLTQGCELEETVDFVLKTCEL